MKENQHTEKQSKLEFKDSEEIFQKFSEQSLAGIYLLQDGYFVYVNPKFADIFGVTVEECQNKIQFLKFVHPDDREFVKTRVEKRIVGEIESDRYGFRGIKKNGEIIHVEIYGSSIVYKGRPAATGTILDVTNRNQAEEINKALFNISNAVNITRDLKELYRSIHDSLSNIMDVTNFFIALVNPKERTLYFPYYVDTMDDDFSPVIKMDSEGSLTALVVSRRGPVLLKTKQLKKIAEQKGVWGSLPLIWMGSPLMVKDEVIGVVATQSYQDPNRYTDKDLQVLSMVSDQIAIAIDRKRSQKALQESEKKYRHLFQNAAAGIFEIDLENFRFLSVNQFMCNHTGFSEKEFLSMSPMDLLTEESRRLYVKRLETLSAGEKGDGNVEYRIKTKEGQILDVILNNDFIYKQGKLTGARVIAHDITELKKAQDEKTKAQKISVEHEKMALVGQVAGKIAHDFNNMLAVIMGNVELAIMDCNDVELKKTLELIYKETIHGKILTRNLVAFARDQEPRQEFFRITEKIDLAVNLLKKDLEKIEVITEYKPGVPELFADPGMIEHAIINLLQNSIHATSQREHPRICIRTDCTANMICLEIEDNGCGIPEEQVKNVFMPSFTLKGNKDATSSYKAGIKGTGYGVSNIKKYVEQHNGNISFTSVFGSGTVFTIHLPVIKKSVM